MGTAAITTFYDPKTGCALLTVDEAANYLGYHPVSIRRLIGQKVLIPHSSAGKTLLFVREDLDRFRLNSAWAARKSTVERPATLAEAPPAALEATVKVDLGLGMAFREPLAPVKDFSWDKLPLIRASIDQRYGNIPFEVEVKSPDGGIWAIAYAPPTWLEKMWKKLRASRSKSK